MLFFFFNDTATTEIYTLSLHDALPILDRIARDADERLAWGSVERIGGEAILTFGAGAAEPRRTTAPVRDTRADRKSTRLNSSHAHISYAVFFLKKKKQIPTILLIS